MLRKISFSEVCKRLTDEGWGFDIYNGYNTGFGPCTLRSPCTLRGEYDTDGYYGSKTIAIRFSHIPGFQFHNSKSILVTLKFIYVQKVPWVTGVGPNGETSHCPPEGKDWRPKDERYMEWWKNSKEIIGEDLHDGNLFSETYLAIDANLHKLRTDYLERISMINEHPIGSMPMDFEIPPHAFNVTTVKYSIDPCTVYINRDMTYWHNCEIVPNDIEAHVPVSFKENNEQDTNDYKFGLDGFKTPIVMPIVNANAWGIETPTAEMNRFHIAVYEDNDLTPYVFGGSETVDDLMNRLNAYVKSVVNVNDYVKNNIALLKKANEYYKMKKEYYQKRTAFITYQNKLEEMGDRLVYDYQVKGQYHV